MNGRERVDAAAAGGQPARRWVLVDDLSGNARRMYRTEDGYGVEAWFNRAGAIRTASLWHLGRRLATVVEHERNKADNVVAWLESPASYFGPDAKVNQHTTNQH